MMNKAVTRPIRAEKLESLMLNSATHNGANGNTLTNKSENNNQSQDRGWTPFTVNERFDIRLILLEILRKISETQFE